MRGVGTVLTAKVRAMRLALVVGLGDSLAPHSCVYEGLHRTRVLGIGGREMKGERVWRDGLRIILCQQFQGWTIEYPSQSWI